MGIEYEAKWQHPLLPDQIVAIRQDIFALPQVEQLPAAVYTSRRQFHEKALQEGLSACDLNQANQQDYLRFTESAPREQWPEDIALTLMPTSCYLVFHGGNLNVQQAIVAQIEHILQHYGIVTLLEEL